MPSLVSEAPVSWFAVPAAEREARFRLGTEDCVVDGRHWFVRGCIEIPVHGAAEPFSWGVWVSLSRISYEQWRACFADERRSHTGPFFGWLNSSLAPYPSTVNLKTRVHLRDGLLRPFVELEPTDHPLAVEQRSGISQARVAELYALVVHGADR